jgi:hypothetical protein
MAEIMSGGSLWTGFIWLKILSSGRLYTAMYLESPQEATDFLFLKKASSLRSYYQTA